MSSGCYELAGRLVAAGAGARSKTPLERMPSGSAERSPPPAGAFFPNHSTNSCANGRTVTVGVRSHPGRPSRPAGPLGLHSPQVTLVSYAM